MKIHPQTNVYLKHLLQCLFCLTVSIQTTLALEPETLVDNQECCEINYLQYSRLEAGYSWGDFIYINEDYAELGLFVPLMLSNHFVIFADARGYRFNDHSWGTSVGLGVRGFICDNQLLGVNVYYDHFKSRYNNDFNRLGVGFEYLGPCCEYRINGYFSVGNESQTFDSFTCPYRGTIYEYNQYEVESSIGNGFDAEMGSSIFCCCNFRVYGAAGPYFYKSNRHGNIWGGYARLEFNLYDYFFIRVRSSYDDVYHSRTQVTALVSVPLDILCNWRCCRDYCLDFLTQPVRRNGILFTNQPCTNSTWNW